MSDERNFAEKVMSAFEKIINEIEKGSVEHDIRPRFVKYFIEPVLGYSGSNYRYEKKRTDITIFDENNFAVIKIETKKPDESIDKPQHEEQAFKYKEDTTKFIGLTNFLHFNVWEINRTGSELKINIDFSRIIEQKKTFEQLTSEEKTSILFLNNLSKDTLFDKSKYEKFDENYARIDITKEAGFNKLLERLNDIANTLLYGYTLKSFGEYKEGYGKYQAELNKAERESKNNRKNSDLNHNIAKYKQKLEEKYEKYKTFAGYELWKEYSGKEDAPEDEVKEIFCKETIYVFLNKLLFLRICEDKGLLEKNISNGGIEELRAFLKKRFKEDTINKEILEISFKSAKGLYSHFYETGILDWFRTGDGEFNELLNRVLWIFNQFDFAHVHRDILGNLYEKYLPVKERKRLGEFYTPTEVIEYILTSVDYTYNHDIETKDLLDPACGSGGFLVEAVRRLISRYLLKFGKTNKKELRNPKNWREIIGRLSPDEAKMILESIQEHIFGLDINPFACHIAEMNLLFQTVDLYQMVREINPDYKFNRFKIFRTDSLEKPTQKHLWDYSYAAFLEEQEETDRIKQKKFDFIVGNPPWGGILKREKGTLLVKRLKEDYVSAIGKYDIYVLFIERGVHWLKDGGRFGYIVQNRFLRVDYSKKIREYLLDNVKIEKIIDFGDTKVFTDATNYPAIIIFEKKVVQKNKFPYIDVCQKANELSATEVIELVKTSSAKSKEYMNIVNINQQELRALKTWTPAKIFINSIIKKIKNIEPLSNVTEEIMEGITLGGQGSDNIYIMDKNTIKNYRIESNMLQKVIKGRDIRKWKLIWDNRYVLYPYDSSNKEVKIGDYPNAFEYLKKYKDQLSERELDGKNISEWGKQWFSLWRIRNPDVFKKQKILSPRLSTENRFTIDKGEEYYITDSAVAIIPKNIDIKYLLGILNSNLIYYIMKNTSPFVQGRYYSFTRTYLDDLPIKIPSSSEERKIADKIIKKVDEIIELSESSVVDISEILNDEETEKLGKLPKVTFSIRDDTTFEKIESKGSKLYINDNDFIEITDKKIMDFVRVYLNFYKEECFKAIDVKGMIINLSVPKSDEVLKEVIKKADIDHSLIKDTIKVLEKEIDELVYEIYDIKNERKIIEDGLKC